MGYLPTRKQTLMTGNALIRLNNVSYISPTSGQVLLDNLTLSIAPSIITTIIGPNGAGKSTLLRLMLGLITPTRGTIDRKKPMKLGYMPQKLVLNPSLPLTVERFLSLSIQKGIFESKHENQQKVHAVLDQTGVPYTRTQSVHTLSGGEWQRVLLARALLQSPDLLMLDEPVQGLDHTGQVEFYKLLRHISATLNCAVVHVSHDLHLVWDASDSIICLNKHICCHGAPEHVRNDPATRALFGGFAPYIHHHDHTHDHSHQCGS